MRALDKPRLLTDLSALAADALSLKPDDVSRIVMAREALGSTGLGHGIGLPHARLEAIAKPFCILARLKRPIEFDAVDGQPVDLVVFILLPSATPDENLNTLATIARQLRDPQRLKRMRRAADAQALFHEMLA